MHSTQGLRLEMSASVASRKEFWFRLNQNKLTPVGAFLIVLILVVCLITPMLPLIDPDETDLAVRLETPFNARHWSVSYTHLRAHETREDRGWRRLL